MSVSVETRSEVRRRAHFACEYCGVAETDTGAELTVDHFKPQACGGSDSLENLLYCCYRCNLYKADYWPVQAGNPVLWNPRREPFTTHFLLLADGTLYGLTAAGIFTSQRLRLNRPPLVAHRLRRHARSEEMRLLTRYRDLVALLEQLQRQHAALLEEHRALLQEQRLVLKLLLENRE